MPSVNTLIEDETGKSFALSGVFATILSVALNCFCKSIHLQSGANIANTIWISVKVNNTEQADQNNGQGDYLRQPCRQSDQGSSKAHNGPDAQTCPNAEAE